MANKSTAELKKEFVKKFKNLIEGDNTELRAEKNWKLGKSSLEIFVAKTKGDITRAETVLDTAVETLTKARLNFGGPIENENTFIASLTTAKNSVTTAESNLQELAEKMSFYQEELSFYGN